MSVNIEKRCDLCGKIVDIVEGVPEDDKLGNYTWPTGACPSIRPSN